MIELTKAEEQVMQILWKLEKAFVKELVEKFPKPKPAYNTVSTIIRILERKGAVSYMAFGKTHQYYPLITKEQYSKEQLTNLVGNYFQGSFKNMVSFFTEQKRIPISELDDVMKMIKQLKNKK